MAGGPVTVLFTDLVSSTAMLERVGDEQAQRVLVAVPSQPKEVGLLLQGRAEVPQYAWRTRRS